MNSERTVKLANWVATYAQQLDPTSHPVPQLTCLAGDASFRKYYRFPLAGSTYIAVDSPSDKEDNPAFISVANAFAKVGSKVPEIIDYEPKQGFFILSDFGDTMLADALGDANADELYQQAFTELLPIQSCTDFAEWQLPDYSERLLLQECSLFSDWFVGQYCQLKLPPHAQQALAKCYQQLITSAYEQPKVCTHRDYHSRNLMVLDSERLGVIDFQSAVRGPISYDVVSLLRDCYVAWPLEKVKSWANDYLERAIELGLYPAKLAASWTRWFDLMGVQRHLKAVGIFARLAKRDKKYQYLEDIPRTLNYVLQVGREHAELTWLVDFIEESVIPAFNQIHSLH